MLIGYARVSTSEQNLDLQADALRQAGCEKVFQDRVSGSVPVREGLEAALSHLRPDDVLVVWKLDRLGRSVRGLVELVEGLRARGVGFRSLTDSIDTTTPSGKFFFHVMAAMAEMERDLIRERTNAGLAAARSRGRQGGRRSVMTADRVAAARRLLDTGTSAAEVAKALGVSRSTLYAALKS